MSRRRYVRSRRTTIAPGDMLMAYSDGITEAEDPAGSPFDEQGVKRVRRRMASAIRAELGAGAVRGGRGAHARDTALRRRPDRRSCCGDAAVAARLSRVTARPWTSHAFPSCVAVDRHCPLFGMAAVSSRAAAQQPDPSVAVQPAPVDSTLAAHRRGARRGDKAGSRAPVRPIGLGAGGRRRGGTALDSTWRASPMPSFANAIAPRSRRAARRGLSPASSTLHRARPAAGASSRGGWTCASAAATSAARRGNRAAARLSSSTACFASRSTPRSSTTSGTSTSRPRTRRCDPDPAPPSSPRPTAGVTAIVVLGDGDMLFSPKPAAERGSSGSSAAPRSATQRSTMCSCALNPSDAATDCRRAARVPRPIGPRATLRARQRGVQRAGRQVVRPGPNDLSRDTGRSCRRTATSSSRSGRATSRHAHLRAIGGRGRGHLAVRSQRASRTSRSTPRSASWRRAAAATTKTTIARLRRPSTTTSTCPSTRSASGSRAAPAATARPQRRAGDADAAARRAAGRARRTPTSSDGCSPCASAARTRLVSLPTPRPQGRRSPHRSYAGRLPPQALDREAIAMQGQSSPSRKTPGARCREPRFVYSNRATGIRRRGHRLRDGDAPGDRARRLATRRQRRPGDLVGPAAG